MRLKVSLPELRRLAALLVASVHEGTSTDRALRDRLLNALQTEMDIPYRRRQAAQDRAAAQQDSVLRRTGHKGL